MSDEHIPLRDFIELIKEPVHISDWMRQYIIDALIDLERFSAPAQPPALQVTCARCGIHGTSDTFMVEEGDEWECPSCWERCEAKERTTDQQQVGHMADKVVHSPPESIHVAGDMHTSEPLIRSDAIKGSEPNTAPNRLTDALRRIADKDAWAAKYPFGNYECIAVEAIGIARDALRGASDKSPGGA